MTGPDFQSHAILDRASRWRKAARMIAVLERRISLAGKRLLEVGCGSGAIAEALATMAPDTAVHAIDVVDERIATDGYGFVRYDGRAMPFADASFDLVVSNHVLEHVGDVGRQVKQLREIHRVLRSDGLVYLAVPNRWRLFEAHYRLPLLSWPPRWCSDALLRISGRAHAYDCHPVGMRRLLWMVSAAGFVAEDVAREILREESRLPGAAIAPRLLARLPAALYALAAPIEPTHILLLGKR